MRTKRIGKDDTILDHVRNKKSNCAKFKTSYYDRMMAVRNAAKTDKGIVSHFVEDNWKKMPPEKNTYIDKNGVMQVKRGTGIVYDNHRFPHIGEVLCREYGFLRTQLAEVFGVGNQTIDQWIARYPDFKAAIKRGREEFDTGKVEKSLLSRALGYEYKERTERNVYLIGKKKHQDIEVAVPAREVTISTKCLPPDVKAIQFWLQNRQPDRWKSVAYIQAQMNQNKTITRVNVDADLENMSVEQIKALRDMVEQSKNSDNSKVIDISDEEVGDFVYKAGQKLLGNEEAIEDYEEEDF